MKKALAIILALTLIIGATCAMAEITIYGAATNTSDYPQQLFSAWDEQFDFQINYENEPGYSDTVNMLTTMLASGDDSVDVLWIDEIMYLAFTRAGFLEPLDSAISDDELSVFLEDYIDMFMKYDGSLYSVPANLAPIAMYVNNEMYEAAGVEVPTNEQEFIDALVKLTDAENGVYGLVLSLDKASHLQDNLNLFSLMFGGNYYDFTLEGTQRAVKFLYDLINTYGVVSKDCLSYDNTAEQQAFIDGYAATCIEWNFTADVEAAGKFGPDKISWVNMPTFVTNAAPYSCWMWVINANSQNKEEALEFVKAQLDAENQAIYQLATWNGMPANMEGWTIDAITNGMPNVAALCNSYVAADSFVARTLSTRHSEYMDVVTGTVQRYLLDEISFEECIETCQSQTAEILANAAA
ncbi:MAG: extracellular solute-binding protein [Clostridia bacterium]|nr:extracellular solute-binding protein [Clostridia bacterium]